MSEEITVVVSDVRTVADPFNGRPAVTIYDVGDGLTITMEQGDAIAAALPWPTHVPDRKAAEQNPPDLGISVQDGFSMGERLGG